MKRRETFFAIHFSRRLESLLWLFSSVCGRFLDLRLSLRYICISSVFHLTESCTSLTVTLVITLRKFVSLIFSIWYFSNPFHREHWIGSLLVFAGTLVFTDPLKVFAPAPAPGPAPKKAKAQ